MYTPRGVTACANFEWFMWEPDAVDLGALLDHYFRFDRRMTHPLHLRR